jgi:murein DD-endopeptidase MepM/ murein hydrolase activator NlpD
MFFCLLIVLIFRASISTMGTHRSTSELPPADSHEVSYSQSPIEGPDTISEKQYTVEPGDTLIQVCQRFGVSAQRIGEWQQAFPEFDEVSCLMPGDEFIFYFHGQNEEPVELVYCPQNSPTTVTFQRGEKDWECRKEEIELEAVPRAVTGSISENLYNSAMEAGLPAGLILALADLFAYDIDFNTDLKQGDTFGVYVEEQMNEGKTYGLGRILAAVMNVSGVNRQAFYYELPDGYQGFFDEQGESLKKMFLRSPLVYSRISSTFTHTRLHPILKTVRPHLGIDYAAPAGTPVSALGSGTVTFTGKKGGFGQYVEIRHDKTYSSGYGHLSGFSKGLKVGSKVEQGEVIGYVGSTGLATGPHLDFRFYRNGKPIDFLATEFPRARSIPNSLRADFKKKCRIYLAELRLRTPSDHAHIASSDLFAWNKADSAPGYLLRIRQDPIVQHFR